MRGCKAKGGGRARLATEPPAVQSKGRKRSQLEKRGEANHFCIIYEVRTVFEHPIGEIDIVRKLSSGTRDTRWSWSVVIKPTDCCR